MDAIENTKKKHSERGASLVEYSLLVALLAVVCIGAVRNLGESITENLDASRLTLGAGGINP
jgi:pilus assembly protein Flp/PilA